MGIMFQFNRDINDYHCSIRRLNNECNLNPGLMTFDQWLVKNTAEIPVF
jgi:hypothetical protein